MWLWLGVACLGLLTLWDAGQEPKGHTLKGHHGWVYSVAYSPDGKTLASGSGDKTIKLWDVATGKEQATLKGHTDEVNSVAYSPDGKTLASGSDDKTIKLWDVATGKEQATLKGHTDWVSSVAFSPDGKTLASGSGDETIKLWDVATGKEQATLKGHTAEVTSVAFSPDGKTLASGSGDKTIKLWDVATGKEQATLKGHTDGCTPWRSVRTARRWPRGAMDKTIKLWDVATGKEQATLKGHTNEVCLRGVQPGRQDAGLGERGQDDQAVGRGDGQGTGHPQGTHGPRCGPWRTVRTARRWPRGARTRRSSCGTRLLGEDKIRAWRWALPGAFCSAASWATTWACWRPASSSTQAISAACSACSSPAPSAHSAEVLPAGYCSGRQKPGGPPRRSLRAERAHQPLEDDRDGRDEHGLGGRPASLAALRQQDLPVPASRR